ncbi:MAG TPA: UDP-N-acetylmuramate dehydrogenase [Pirellulales bacterium]
MPRFDDFRDFVRTQEPLAPYTWLRVGGAAEYFAEPRTRDELLALVKYCQKEGVPFRILGGGSNLLVRDGVVPGLVVHLSNPAFAEISVKGRVISAGAGAKLGQLVSTAVREGLAGLETLVGIPGTVGGALHGNAGGRGGDIGQWTRSAVVLTKAGELQERKRPELVFAYRQSSLDDVVILSAEFELNAADATELHKRMQKNWIVSKANQPLSHQCTTCVFKNPRGMSAGMLIDQAGMKGLRVGGAEVSDRHANFVVAHPGATSADVQKLIDQVRKNIDDRLGIELENEIQIW